MASVLTWITIALACLQGGYMLLDGAKALITGTYITPSSGEHAGQLGPWTHLVSHLGIPPESTAMKITFVVFGLGWLSLALGIGLHAPWAWPTGLILAIATLWYLVPGTIISLAVLVLLLTTPLRHALGSP